MKRILNIAAVSLLAAVILSSCEPGPQGLFAGLERETPKNKGTAAFNANTAAFVTRLGAHYYAGVGSTILRRLAAGGTWELIPDSGAPAGSIITAGVSDGTNLYVSYSPAAGSIRFTNNGTTWGDYVDSGLPAGEPVQNLLFMTSHNRLAAVTQHSTGSSSSDYTTYFTISTDNGSGTFTPEPNASNQICGLPSSIAWDGANYWIPAGNTVFRGTAPGFLNNDSANVAGAFTTANPVLGIWHDFTNDVVLAAATGKLWKLEAGGYTPSGTFGSAARRLSSVIVVPANGGLTEATLVGVKSWASDKYTGYYEYDADLNDPFGTSVVPNSTWDLVADNSDYVTTLDDLSIDGFYYDSTDKVLFARTVGGGLWSKKYSGTTWTQWDRE